MKNDSELPLDHPERKRFQNLLDWMQENGSDFSKLKLKYYTADYRGVHTSKDVKKGETLLFVPQPLMITM